MSVPQWNADIITPEEEGSGTKVLDGNQVVQPTLEGGTNITISDGTISATGGGAEYYAGEGIVISNENAISITETVRDGAALGATSVQPADLSGYVLSSSLATVATSGDYDDLLDKPTIPTVDQTYNAASTNAQSGTAVAQAIAAIPSSSYTAGDGIDITSGEISVKAGTGLEIDDISIPGGTANLVSQDIVYNEFMGTWDVFSIAPLTSGLLSQMSNSMDVTTVGSFYCDTSLQYYAALYTFSGGSATNIPGNRLVLGSAHSSPYGVIDPGTVITFDTGDIDTANSTVTLAQVESDLSNYRLGLLVKDGSSWYISAWQLFDSAQSVTTATYTEMTTVQDALCVSNPLPDSAIGDSGKVLTVNNSGAAAWATPSTPTVDQTYNAASTNAQSGTAVAGAIATVDEVPDVTSTDDGKVLKAAYSGGAGSYSWQAEPAVLDLVAGNGISITEGTTDLTIAADVLPAYDTTTDAGKVLQVTANGLAWVTLS